MKSSPCPWMISFYSFVSHERLLLFHISLVMGPSTLSFLIHFHNDPFILYFLCLVGKGAVRSLDRTISDPGHYYSLGDLDYDSVCVGSFYFKYCQFMGVRYCLFRSPSPEYKGAAPHGRSSSLQGLKSSSSNVGCIVLCFKRGTNRGGKKGQYFRKLISERCWGVRVTWVGGKRRPHMSKWIVLVRVGGGWWVTDWLDGSLLAD